MKLTSDQVEYYERFGFLHVRDFWTDEEIETIHARCVVGWDGTSANSKVPGDALSQPGLAEILFSDKVLDVLRSLLGDTIVYFGDSSTGVFPPPTGRKKFNFHNDARRDDYDFSKPYPLVRIGVYPQEHEINSGGLKIRPGSATKPCLGLKQRLKRSVLTRTLPSFYLGKWISLPSRPNDLSLWNFRTHHFPHGVRLKANPKFSLSPRLEHWVPRSLRMPAVQERCLLGFSVGAPSAYLDKYIEFIGASSKYVEHFRHSTFDSPEIQELAKQRNVTLRFDCLERHRAAGSNTQN